MNNLVANQSRFDILLGMQPMIRPMKWQVFDPFRHRLAGWLASEKLDGWRCIWDGENLYSLEGKMFDAPLWFTTGLPAGVCLDGELWHSREGALAAVQGAMNRNDFSELSFHPFDAPLVAGGFRQRLAYVERVCIGTTAIPIPHEEVAGSIHAEQLAVRFWRAGGEGAVFRHPDGPYRQGCRSGDVLKCRPNDGVPFAKSQWHIEHAAP